MSRVRCVYRTIASVVSLIVDPSWLLDHAPMTGQVATSLRMVASADGWPIMHM
jgi:hypothetical protein